MSLERLTAIIGPEHAPTVLGEVQEQLGTLANFEVASGGLVHHVFRVYGESGDTAYLKVRSDRYSGLPEIATDPRLIANEHRVLQWLSVRSSQYFPGVKRYNPQLNYLLLDDIMPGATTLDKKYERNAVTPDDLFHLGKAVGEIHARHQDVQEPVRRPNDQRYQAGLWSFVLHAHERPELQEATDELLRRPTQLIIGDLSPKNSYVENGRVGLCDLENAHQGPIAYDQAFAMAHLILHHTTQQRAMTGLQAFLDGYHTNPVAIDQKDAALKTVVQGVLLYRLNSLSKYYPLAYAPSQRIRMMRNVHQSIDQNPVDFEVLVANVFKDLHN